MTAAMTMVMAMTAETTTLLEGFQGVSSYF
jgi:hypothetical protein